MNIIKFNRPAPVKTFSSILDEFFNQSFPDPINSEINWNTPSTNIKETEDGYSIEMAVPGINKSNVDIRVDKDQLIIESKQTSENVEENDDKNYRLRQFNFSAFRKSFYLNETIDSNKINAHYKDGILYIDLEKKEEAKPKEPRTIEIK